jgi:succinate dehydrogenase / fumarate reductase membrane anchor subunit
MNLRSVPQKGIKDWVAQRVTAVLLVIYLVILGVMLLSHQPLDFQAWQNIFQPLWFKIFSVIAFLSVVIHAWIGIWTIFTDYIHPWGLRFTLMWVVALVLLGYFIWLLQILWGV